MNQIFNGSSDYSLRGILGDQVLVALLADAVDDEDEVREVGRPIRPLGLLLVAAAQIGRLAPRDVPERRR